MSGKQIAGKQFRVTPSVLDEWMISEIGSWEDAHCPQDGHVYNILSRHKSVLEVRSLKEAALLIKSADYQGDTCGICDDLVRSHQAIGRIGKNLIDAYRPLSKE